MVDIAFKQKMTKKDFEAKLLHDFGFDDLSKSSYSENTVDANSKPVVQKMTLYRIKYEHIGTWMNGEGCIFSKAYRTHDDGEKGEMCD